MMIFGWIRFAAGVPHLSRLSLWRRERNRYRRRGTGRPRHL